jgi:hypothetical protein
MSGRPRSAPMPIPVPIPIPVISTWPYRTGSSCSEKVRSAPTSTRSRGQIQAISTRWVRRDRHRGTVIHDGDAEREQPIRPLPQLLSSNFDVRGRNVVHGNRRIPEDAIVTRNQLDGHLSLLNSTIVVGRVAESASQVLARASRRVVRADHAVLGRQRTGRGQPSAQCISRRGERRGRRASDRRVRSKPSRHEQAAIVRASP